MKKRIQPVDTASNREMGKSLNKLTNERTKKRDERDEKAQRDENESV